MDIKKTQNGNETTFALSGKLDSITAPRFEEELIKEFDAAKCVILDLGEIAYVSSAGLRVLLAGEKTAKAKGCIQTLINISDDVMEVFEMTGFSGVLHITK